MELYQLRYFIAAAECQNISKAAKQVCVSQPALSRQIRLLEEELGAELFQRVRQRVILAEAGKFLLSRALLILSDADNLVSLVRRQFSEIEVVRFGAITPFLDDLVAPTVRDLSRSHPSVELKIVEAQPARLLSMLRKGELDIAILGNLNPKDKEDFTVETLFESSFAAVLPESHSHACKRFVRLSDLKNQRWVTLSDQCFPGRRRFFLSACREAGFEPRVEAEVESIPALIAEVSARHLVAILPRHCQKFSHAGCLFISLSKPQIKTSLLLLGAKGKQVKNLDIISTAIRLNASKLK